MDHNPSHFHLGPGSESSNRLQCCIKESILILAEPIQRPTHSLTILCFRYASSSTQITFTGGFFNRRLPAHQISEWANENSIEMGKGPIRKIPFFVMFFAAKAGDIMAFLKIRFPITSFRLSNMTTNNILPLEDLSVIAGPPPVGRLDGVKKTIAWLIDRKDYKIRR